MTTAYSKELPYLEIGVAREEAELTVILMHGLGSDGHDFADVAQMLYEAARPRRWRFVLPHAPKIPVTINMRVPMPAWYDILDLSNSRKVDWETVATSQKQLEAIIANEPAEKLILAGFSQGAAMALHLGIRHQDRISGVLAMSGYLMQAAQHPVPRSEGPLPINILHGNADDVVPIKAAEEALNSLKLAGFTPAFKSYIALAHSVSQEEIRDVFDWLSEQAS
ncbi:alpha/beta hydrolase [Haloferula sp.]|uniref:alpha/beta hydrolase n=1 Tax=Haloferula sp. TaxID=2497595 RepID=UPI00329F2DC5